MEKISYFVDGRLQQSDRDALLQREILEKAGYAEAEYYLIGEDGTEYRGPDDKVPLKDGEKFEVKPLRGAAPSGVIHYKVNGEIQTAEDSPIPLRDILEKAGRKAGIEPNDLERYRLENSGTEARYEGLDEPVPIHDGDQFVAIYIGKTPVA